MPDNPSFLLPCKHLQGFRLLITEQLSHWKMRYKVAKETIAPSNFSAARADSYLILWNNLSRAWAEAEEQFLDREDLCEWLLA